MKKYEDYEEEESKLKKFLKKTYILIVTLFLVTLLFFSTNTGYHLTQLFSGKIISSTLNEDFTFDLKFGGKVYFDKSVFESLRTIYWANQQHETKVCVIGYKENNNYYAKGLYQPKIYNQDVYSVTAQQCSKDTIISLHSHPPLRCIFSEQDIRSYQRFKQINPEAIIGLMCDEERLTFFGYSN